MTESDAGPLPEGPEIVTRAVLALAHAMWVIWSVLGDDILARSEGIPADIVGLRFPATRKLALGIATAAELFASYLVRHGARPGRGIERRLAASLDVLHAEAKRVYRVPHRRGKVTTPKTIHDPNERLFGEIEAVVAERGLEKFGSVVMFESRDGGSQIAFRAGEVSPEYAHMAHLERLVHRLEAVVLGNPLLEYERRASRWWFEGYTAPPDVRRHWKSEHGSRRREQELSLLDRRTLATGRPVLDGILDRRVADALATPSAQRRVASTLRNTLPGVYLVRECEGPGPVLEVATDGVFERAHDARSFRVRACDPALAYGPGMFVFGRLLPYRDGAYLSSLGTTFFDPGGDGGLQEVAASLSRRLAEWDEEREGAPPSIAIEATMTSLYLANTPGSGGPRTLPRDVPPAASRRAARELLDEVRSFFEQHAAGHMADRGDELPERDVSVDRVVGDWLEALERQAKGGAPPSRGRPGANEPA